MKCNLSCKDYTFNDESFAVITCNKQQDDKIEIYEYETTTVVIFHHSTKLGLYRETELYVHNTYTEEKM